MKTYFKYYFIIIIFLFASCVSYATSNNLFLEEIQSKRETLSNINLFSIGYSTNSSYQANLISLQINPFYKLSYPIKNLEIRLNYINYDVDELYSNKNSEVAFVYNIINRELLTLYINYAIYSMYNLRFYDFNSDKEVKKVDYGKSFGFGFDAKVFRDFYLTFEKRWVVVDDVYIKDLDSFYVGLKYKVSFKMLQED